MPISPRAGGRLSTRLFFSYFLVLSFGLLVAFIASEALAPTLFARQRGRMMAAPHTHHQMERRGGGAVPPGESARSNERRGLSHSDAPRTGESIPSSEDLQSEDLHSPLARMIISGLDQAHRRAMQHALLFGLGAALLIAGLASFYFSRRISAPLEHMRAASRRIAQGNYDERLETGGPGEIGDFALAFNEMARELAATEERRRSLIGNVAHELRTPLSSLRGYLEGIADGYFPADATTLASCARQVERMGRLVDDLSLLSRVEAGIETVTPQRCELSSLFDQLEVEFREAFHRKHVRLSVIRPSNPTPLFADPDRTLQILGNLLSNSLRHTPEGGVVTVELNPRGADRAGAGTPAPPDRDHAPDPAPPERDSDDNSGLLAVEVRDTGTGIPAEALPHIFERFYRADPARTRNAGSDTGGSGIGLTISRALAKAQGGDLRITSRKGAGTTATLYLPGADNLAR